MDSDSVVVKYKEQFVGKNEGHEDEDDPTTIYNCLNKLYKRVTYNSRGKSSVEFLKKKVLWSKVAFLSEVLNDSPPQKEKMWLRENVTKVANLMRRKTKWTNTVYELVYEVCNCLKNNSSINNACVLS